jgi:hypothetical protein
MSEPIHQEVDFTVSPQRIYGALTDAKSSPRFQEASQQRSNLRLEACSNALVGKLAEESSSLLLTDESSKRGTSLCGPRVPIQLSDSSSRNEAPGHASSSTTQVLQMSIASTWMPDRHECTGSP